MAGITRFVRWVLAHRAAHPHGTWVLTREGPVCFYAHGTILVEWSAVRGAREHGAGVVLELADGPVRVFAHPGPVPPLGREVHLPADALGELTPAVFVAQIGRAIADPSARKGLPTFAHPDGPPEAVLAGLGDL